VISQKNYKIDNEDKAAKIEERKNRGSREG
jgi:hypothetical protein